MREARRWRRRAAVVAAGLLAVTGLQCASTQYVYRPEQATVWIDGYPAERSSIPPERPQGEVRVAAFGIAELEHGQGQRVRMLHVRLVVQNDGDNRPWVVDTREQLIVIADVGWNRPAFVNSDLDSLPLVQVARRTRRVLDLYYPLPSNVQDEGQLPGFDITWEVRTAARRVAGRASFERLALEYYYPDVSFYAGWGSYWWYDPFYYGYYSPFVYPSVIIHQHPGNVYYRGRSGGHHHHR
jgi:hypothetical protein